MAQLIVRRLEEAVKRRLRARAKNHGRSMEEEARTIIREAVGNPVRPSAAKSDKKAGGDAGFGTRFASHFKNLDEPFKVPDWDEPVRFPKFRR